jgi:hypothetical protein
LQSISVTALNQAILEAKKEKEKRKKKIYRLIKLEEKYLVN